MSTRTYRVIVRGVLAGLDDAQRARLREQAADHDLFASAFTEQGSLTYDAQLGPFSHRVVVRVDGGPGEEDDAATAGELSAIEHLQALGVQWRSLRSSVTSVDDVKVRRPR